MFNLLFTATLEETRKHSQMINDAFRLAMAENYNDDVLFDLIKQNEWAADNDSSNWN